MRKDVWMTTGSGLPVAASVGDQVQNSVDLVVLGELDAARDVLEHLDLDMITAVRSSRLAAAARAIRAPRDLPGEPRTRRTLAREKSETFARDHWTCRFCGAQTIDLQVLRRLSRLFPETLPFHPNWKFTESHLIYWTLSTSLEHVVPFARGGADEPANFVTTCYACNDARGDLLLHEIGWALQPIVETEWQGLTENLAGLKAMSNQPKLY